MSAPRTHALHPLPPAGRTFVAGFESTHHPSACVDALDTTGHSEHWEQDLAEVMRAGVRLVRYPVRWQLVEPEPGRFDWAETDRVLDRLRTLGMTPIVDLVHHTTYPSWLSDGFRGADFGPALERYAAAVAERYPWLGAYTLFNEPFATLFLAGHQGSVAALRPRHRRLPEAAPVGAALAQPRGRDLAHPAARRSPRVGRHRRAPHRRRPRRRPRPARERPAPRRARPRAGA